MSKIIAVLVASETTELVSLSIWAALSYAACLLFPLKLALPLFVLCSVVVVGNAIFNPRVSVKEVCRNFSRCFREFPMLWILSLPIVAGCLFSERLYVFALRDTINVVILFCFAWLWVTYVRSSRAYLQFQDRFLKSFIALCFVAAVVGFLKFHSAVHVFGVKWLVNAAAVDGTPLKADYNTYALFLIAGLWFLFWLNRSVYLGSYSAIILSVLLSASLFSASRRGFLLVGLLALFCLARLIWSRVKVFCRASTHRLGAGAVPIVRTYEFAFLFVYTCLMFFFFLIANTNLVYRIALRLEPYGYQPTTLVTQALNITARYGTFKGLELGFLPDILVSDSGDVMNESETGASSDLGGRVSQRWKTLKARVAKDEQAYASSPVLSRFARWAFSMELYAEKYSLLEKLFGSGFNYLSKFADEFSKRYYFPGSGYSQRYYEDFRFHEDYPHNFLLSALLYSGAAGVMLFLPFAITIVRALAGAHPADNPFSVLIVVSLFYLMSSGNSFFSMFLFPLLYLIVLLRAKVFRDGSSSFIVGEPVAFEQGDSKCFSREYTAQNP